MSNALVWKKLGKVFDPTTVRHRPWLREFAQAPATLVFDHFVRVYFSCRPSPDADGQYVSHTAFVDLDRNNLFKVLGMADSPILSLGELGMFDEFGIYPTSVIRDGPIIRAYYGGWTRCESVPFNVAIGCAESLDDGVSFTRIGKGPVLSYTPDEPFILSGPKIRKFGNTWYLFYIAGSKWIRSSPRPEPVYRIRMASSSDGVSWTRLNRDLISPRIEADECQASPDVFFDGNKFHMFFCYRRSLNYRGKEGGYRIGYAVSEDLHTWHRNDDRVGIDVSEDGWDNEMISYPHVFELDGKVYMFYLGNAVGRFGFGAALLESDLN